MFILFDHTNHIAYFGMTYKGIQKRTGITKRRLQYLVRVNRPIKGLSCVIAEPECKRMKLSKNITRDITYK